jgi:hypothetical protein
VGVEVEVEAADVAVVGLAITTATTIETTLPIGGAAMSTPVVTIMTAAMAIQMILSEAIAVIIGEARVQNTQEIRINEDSIILRNRINKFRNIRRITFIIEKRLSCMNQCLRFPTPLSLRFWLIRYHH